MAELSDDDRVARDASEHAYDLAHFRKMRELAAGLGVDAFEREAKYGVHRSIRPPPVNRERVREFQEAIARALR